MFQCKSATPIDVIEFVCEPAYKDMVAIEVAKLTRAAEEYKNFLQCSNKEALVKLKEEFPLHKAFGELHEFVVNRVFACGP